MTAALAFVVGCTVGLALSALIIGRRNRMPDTVGQKFSCGFPEEWEDFEKRHRVFLERFPNLVAALNAAFILSLIHIYPPIARKFIKPEIMIRVKCNIHSWMHAFIGVLDHPYFSVSQDDGSFAIKNLPPGTYTIAVWQEKLGTQEQQVTVAPNGTAQANFTFKEK